MRDGAGDHRRARGVVSRLSVRAAPRAVAIKAGWPVARAMVLHQGTSTMILVMRASHGNGIAITNKRNGVSRTVEDRWQRHERHDASKAADECERFQKLHAVFQRNHFYLHESERTRTLKAQVHEMSEQLGPPTGRPLRSCRQRALTPWACRSAPASRRFSAASDCPARRQCRPLACAARRRLSVSPAMSDP
jgi:hypothetical protein